MKDWKNLTLQKDFPIKEECSDRTEIVIFEILGDYVLTAVCKHKIEKYKCCLFGWLVLINLTQVSLIWEYRTSTEKMFPSD